MPIRSNIQDNKTAFSSDILKLQSQNLENKIKIPVYQRKYTWKKTKVEQLFNDFKEHLDYVESTDSRDKVSYYLGNIVLVETTSNDKKVFEVLDGQQRLTSLYILICAIRYSFKKIYENALNNLETNDQVQQLKSYYNDIIEDLNDHILNYDNEPFLEIYFKDDRIHFSHILNNINFDENKPRNILKSHPIYTAMLTFIECIEDFLDERTKVITSGDLKDIDNQKFKELKEFMLYVTGKYSELTYTLLRSGEMEYTVFETLNDRGENLTCYDLTRNIMFGIADGWEDIHKKTQKIFDDDTDNEIDSINENCRNKQNKFVATNARKLILDSWNMFNRGKINEGNYMREFQSFIKTKNFGDTGRGGFYRKSKEQKELFLDHLKLLHDCSFSIAELINPKPGMFNNYGGSSNNSEKKELIERLSNFSHTGFKQYYSLYFALKHKKVSISILIKYIDLVEKIYINLIFTYSLSPSKIENIMSEMATEIYEHDSSNYENIYKNHYDKFKDWEGLDKEKFETLFADKNTSSGPVNYIFRRMNSQLDSGQVFRIDTGIEIEHVLPEKPELWIKGKKITKEEHKEYLNKIGNKTLLTPEKNKIVKNDPYSRKISFYNKQNFIFTNETNNRFDKKLSVNYYKDWNKDSIIKRSNAIAKHAKNIWGF